MKKKIRIINLLMEFINDVGVFFYSFSENWEIKNLTRVRRNNASKLSWHKNLEKIE